MSNTAGQLTFGLFVLASIVALLTAFGVFAKVRVWLSAGADKLAAKTGLAFLAQLDEVMVGYALDLYETEIKHAKEAAADGKLTPEESAKFMAILVERTKAHFGLGALAGLVAGGGDLTTALKARGEVAVLEAKARGAAAKKPDPFVP